MTLKAQAAKEKLDKWDTIKIKNFCISKDIIHRVKRKPTEWKKKFTNRRSVKRLILTTQQQKQPTKLKNEQNT